MKPATESDTKFAENLLEQVLLREKSFASGWWKLARESAALYNLEAEEGGDKSGEVEYNILYSNTEVLLPSIFSATPKPDVRMRYKELPSTPIPQLLERMLTLFADAGDPGTESLTAAMPACVGSALTAALGYVRLRYYEEKSQPLVPEFGAFDTLIWGKARKWTKVPWVAFRHSLTREEFFKTFDVPEDEQGQYKYDETAAETKKGDTVVYEVWHKASRSIYFICEDWQPTLVRRDPDVMKLSGFYPTPGPLAFATAPGHLEPKTLYAYYRNQAIELDRVTVRLNHVLAAIRVRGAYHGLLGELMEQVLDPTLPENGLVRANDAAFMAQSGGFDKAVWLLPIEKLADVARELYAARQQIKQVIYELTGISDILRGSSLASETATAQNLKNKWGAIRLRKMQQQTAEYVRDLFRLYVDAATSVIPPQKWLEMTSMPLPTNEQQQVIRQRQAQLSQMLQTAVGAPPEMTQSLQAELQQLQGELQKPTIESLIEQIRSDANRAFTINVQTSSTVDLDTAADKDDVPEFLSSLGQSAPALQILGNTGPTGFNAIKEMLVSICQRYKFGIPIADALRAMEPPPPPPPPDQPSPEEKQKVAMEMEVFSMEMEFKKQELAAKRAELQQKTELAQAQHQLELRQISLKMTESELKMQLARKKAADALQTPAPAPAKVPASGAE